MNFSCFVFDFLVFCITCGFTAHVAACLCRTLASLPSGVLIWFICCFCHSP